MQLLVVLLLLAQLADFPPFVTCEVRHPVHPAKVGEKTVLVYELLVVNYGGKDETLTAVDVLDPSGRVLATREAADLAYRVLGPDQSPPLKSGRQANVFLWLETPSPPARLRHRLRFASGKSIEGAEVAVTADRGPLLEPPFPPGGRWLAANGPSNASGHRRTLLPIHSQPWLSQRFAIDWVRVGPDGQSYAGDSSRNESYHCYGVEALAAADATVVAVQDGIPDNMPGIDSRAVVINLETIGGNWVALDLGGGRYAMYAHFIPGSLKVRPGQRIRKGEVLGRIGNSGNSTEPHLHFHVADSPRWLEADGLPYRFARFRSFVKPEDKTGTVRLDQLPPENQLVEFTR